MKAAYIEQTGGVEALTYGDLPKPQPGAGEVLVKVAASGPRFRSRKAIPHRFTPRPAAREGCFVQMAVTAGARVIATAGTT